LFSTLMPSGIALVALLLLPTPIGSLHLLQTATTPAPLHAFFPHENHRTVNCIACHQLDGVGRQIGPQLEGIGARGGKPMQFEDAYVLCFGLSDGKFRWACYVASGSVPGEVFEVKTSIVYRKGNPLSAMEQEFLELMRQVLKPQSLTSAAHRRRPAV
jgi:hypothetical protein